MKPKTAIIILIIIVIACGLFMVYLADVMELEKNHKNTVLKQAENSDGQTDEKLKPLQLSDEEIKEKLIQKAKTPESEKRREEIEKMAEDEREELKLKLINKAK
ncbi:hypothetical protein KAU09_05570 [Candidatus Parcubacteria bacterium]|nr:hypothetical protein [Candidatus Parcubacteria bacterium]